MADNPTITCPECKKKFQGKGNLAGKKIKCPFCTKAFVVPAEGKAPSIAGFADEDDKNPYGVTELDLTPRCPNCAQEMEDEKAFICLYCGYNSLTREIGKTQKLMSHTTGERFKHLLPGIAAVMLAFLWIVGLTYYCVVLPEVVHKSRLAFLDHESLRMWLTIISLSFIWGCGLFGYKRFIVEPTPPEKKKE